MESIGPWSNSSHRRALQDSGEEALVCWRRGEVVLPAAAFFPLIENTPLSGRITYWVIDTVAAELGEWLAAHGDAHISINRLLENFDRGLVIPLLFEGSRLVQQDHAFLVGPGHLQRLRGIQAFSPRDRLSCPGIRLF